MNTYKLVALDMDGTVLDDKQQISQTNQLWIQRALDAGIIVMFATGRAMDTVKPYMLELNMNTPTITVNGGDIWENPNTLLKRHQMEYQWIEQLHQLAVQYDTWFWAYSSEGLYNKENWIPNLENMEWLKFGYYTEDDQVRNRILKTISAWNVLEVTNSHPYNIEINPKGVNKATALHEVCRMLNINMSEVVAMGDSLNDIAMIREAGLGVAMGNAQEEVKKASNLITSTNTEDGVAQVIKDYVLRLV